MEDPRDFRAPTVSATSRRTFVKGLAVGGAAAGLGLWRPSLSASSGRAPTPTDLAGTDFDLTIGETPMDFTGSPRGRRDGERLRPRPHATVA